MPNVLVAGAYAGHGVALSVHAGALLADAVIDGVELPAWGKLISTENTEDHR
jgi:glycine/D-amino acid oxidase-like deaminating enzyme